LAEVLAGDLTERQAERQAARQAERGGDIGDQVAAELDLRAALGAMPLRRRTCAVACWVLGLTPDEAGKELGIAASTVRKQLELARSSLATGCAGGPGLCAG
ncbi:MAG: sigma factor-like helix-turn-helix DNA-binding protein, partial [Acidimicrobiales bacterium]